MIIPQVRATALFITMMAHIAQHHALFWDQGRRGDDLTKPGGDEVGTKLPSDNPKMDTSTDEYPCRYRAVS